MGKMQGVFAQSESRTVAALNGSIISLAEISEWRVSSIPLIQQKNIFQLRIERVVNCVITEPCVRDLANFSHTGYHWGATSGMYSMQFFLKGLRATRSHKARFGHANAKLEYRATHGLCLGWWQYRIRKRYHSGRLSPKQVGLLKALGFSFEVRTEKSSKSRKGVDEFIAYRRRHRSPDVPFHYRTSDGYRLGFWQQYTRQKYRKGKLTQSVMRELNRLGFLWESSWRNTRLTWKEFLKRVRATRRYKAEHGRANAPWSYRTPDGFRLGQWQSHLRSKYHQGGLTAREIRAMEALGFRWKIHDSPERGFQETLKSKAMTDNPNVRREYKTPDGFKLGRWQSRMRCLYQAGRLPKDRIKRLSEIGFVWHLIKETYRRGIEETRKYQKKYGAANCPGAFATAEGYRLGQWQSRIKMRRKKGKLAPDIIKELEAMGFEWRRSYKKLKGWLN